MNTLYLFLNKTPPHFSIQGLWCSSTCNRKTMISLPIKTITHLNDPFCRILPHTHHLFSGSMRQNGNVLLWFATHEFSLAKFYSHYTSESAINCYPYYIWTEEKKHNHKLVSLSFNDILLRQKGRKKDILIHLLLSFCLIFYNHLFAK